MKEAVIDAVIDQALRENRIVGAVMIVRLHGQDVYAKAHGLADRETQKPMALDAIFRLSSVTKPVVAATILAMCDEGMVRLDDAISDYLIEFKPRLPDGSSPPILLSHLLTHTSGLASRPLPWAEGDKAVLAAIASEPLLFAPGSAWAYGPSIDILGALAGRLVGGQPEDAIKKYVLDPLGMTDTRFSVMDASRLATPYGDGALGPERMGESHSVTAPWGNKINYDPTRIFNPAAFQSGGGGMAGTARDIMTLLDALRSGDGGFLKQKTVHEAMSNQTPHLEQAVEPAWGFSYFGACLTDKDKTSHPGSIGTNRWGGIYGHHWIIDPANGITVVSMTNTGLEGSDGAYRHETTKAVYDALAH